MNKYERIERASELTKELERVEKEIKRYNEGEIEYLGVSSKDFHTSGFSIKSIRNKADVQSAEYLAMVTEFFKQNIIKYYEMRKDSIIKEIDQLIE